jgi:hypothetical protein
MCATDTSLNRLTFSATAHCFTGCAVGYSWEPYRDECSWRGPATGALRGVAAEFDGTSADSPTGVNIDP